MALGFDGKRELVLAKALPGELFHFRAVSLTRPSGRRIAWLLCGPVVASARSGAFSIWVFPAVRNW